jgi:hypothetical protein
MCLSCNDCKMEISELVDRFPRVHHVTTGGSWDGIAATGLLSTSALLDRYEIRAPRRYALESRPRPEAVELAHPSHGRAVLFDNRPLRPDILRGCLDCSVEEWCRLLNARVFCWATESRLENHLRARGHRGQGRDVITLSTERLAARHAEAITLCAFNSGSTLYPNAPRRGPDTFMRIEDYPYDDHRRRRGRKNALAEVCVTGRIGEIVDVVEQVVRIESDGTLHQVV